MQQCTQRGSMARVGEGQTVRRGGTIALLVMSLAGLAACSVTIPDPVVDQAGAAIDGGKGRKTSSDDPSGNSGDSTSGAPSQDAGSEAASTALDAGSDAVQPSPTDAAVVDGASSTDAGVSEGGAVSGCAPPPTSTLVVSVKDTGAKGDGVTDDTAAFQAAVDQVAGSGGTVSVPAGTYMIDALKSVNLGSNMTFKMDSAATLQAITNGADSYNVLFASGKSHVNIVGGTILGERATHTGTTGEWGMGINVSASDHVVIEGVTAKNCWGDGFYASWSSDTVTLCSVIADGNRRQGISISGADNVTIQDSTFENTSGTWPMAGIDIEPDQGLEARHQRITNCKFLNNGGAGILLYGEGAPISDVTLTGNTVANNNAGGGIALLGVQTGTIDGNTVQDADNFGIQLANDTSGVTVTGNDITVSGNAAGHAIDNQGTNNTISGNTLH